MSEAATATRSGIPEVVVNFALSWDARVASAAAGSASGFSSERDYARLLAIRASGDAVMVGRGTLEADRMELGLPDETLRQERLARGAREYPLRVMVSGSGAIDPESRPFVSLGGDVAPIVIFTTPRMSAESREGLGAKATIYIDEHAEKSVSLRWMLETLAEEHGVKRLVCEGGPSLFRALLEEDLVDEINLTFCPVIFGGTSAKTLTGAVDVRPDFLPASRECRLEAVEVIDGECFARYRVL